MDWALVAASLGLLLATVVLAWFTWGLWAEARAGRRPRLVATLDLFPARYAEIRFVNAGSGPALDVDVKFSLEPGATSRRWSEPLVAAGDGVSFKLLAEADRKVHPEATDLDSIAALFPEVSAVGSYRDVSNKIYRIDQVIEVEALWREAKESGRLAAFRGPLLPLYEVLESIRDSLRALSKHD